MRRRTLIVVVAGLAMVVTVGAVVLWPQPPSRITRENYDRVQLGMSQAEVLAILGPPGDDRVEDSELDSANPGCNLAIALDWSAQDLTVSWWTDRVAVHISADPSGKVSAKRYFPQRAVNHNSADNLLWRAKRQWHRWFP